MTSKTDIGFMREAIAAARRQLGRTAPNPSVGCSIVRDDEIIALAATADRGRPHAERRALDLLGGDAAGATAYVTLEPCAHYGQTPPCALALIEAGVARVVIAVIDADERVSGQGIAMLEAAGVKVETGLGETEAKDLYEGFFHRLETGRPLFFTAPFPDGLDARVSLTTPGELDAMLTQAEAEGWMRVGIDADATLIAQLRQDDRIEASFREHTGR